MPLKNALKAPKKPPFPTKKTKETPPKPIKTIRENLKNIAATFREHRLKKPFFKSHHCPLS